MHEPLTELELLKLIAVLAAKLVLLLETGASARAPGVIVVRTQLGVMLDRLDARKAGTLRLPVDTEPEVHDDATA